jgi:hypothetical protein
VDASLAHEVGAHFRRDDLVDAAGGAVREDRAVKVADPAAPEERPSGTQPGAVWRLGAAYMPSPIESKSPSEPHMHTLHVTIRFWKALDWLVKRHDERIGAVYPAVRSMISAPLYAHSRAISGNMPSWQMISASLQPLGPSMTGMPTLPGSHGSTGTAPTWGHTREGQAGSETGV